jgi:hypothetical protein
MGVSIGRWRGRVNYTNDIGVGCPGGTINVIPNLLAR